MGTIQQCLIVVAVVVGSLGLLGNLLSFVTIVSMRKRSLFYNLLLILTVYDTVFIVNGAILFVNGYFLKADLAQFPALIVAKLVIPLKAFGLTGSTYTCVAIALERYLGICRTNLNNKFQKLPYFLGFILSVNIFSSGTRFFEYSARKVAEDNQTGTVEDDEIYRVAYSDLRTDDTYIAVIIWHQLLMTALVPFVLMVALNARIIYFYKKNSLLDPHQSSSERDLRRSSSVSSKHKSQELALFLLFFCITVTFLVCHLPRLIYFLNLALPAILHDADDDVELNRHTFWCRTELGLAYFPPIVVYVGASLEQLSLILNSSVNFVYYCWLGRNFRQQMARTLCGRCGRCGRSAAAKQTVASP